MLNLPAVGIRWRQFLSNTFPLSFKISYDRGQLLWITTIPFFSHRFCSSVWIRTVFPVAIFGSLRLRFWVMVRFLVAALWVDGVSYGKVVLNLRPNNFLAGKVPFWSGCEFRDSIARKWSSDLNFALFGVRFSVWMDLSLKPFAWG